MSSDNKMLKAMYRGELPIGNLMLDCAVLSDETRILSTKSIFTAFERPSRGNRELDKFEYNGEMIILPPFLASKTLFPLINQDLLALIKPIIYLDGESEKTGYKAEILPAMCSLYLEARRQNLLTTRQKKLATQSEILLEAFAKIGITALIDEATGYQYNRKSDALRFLLQQYIAEGIQKWIKRFPDEFFSELDRIYENEKTTSRNRPMYYGKFINEYIYEPIEEGYIKAELDKLNITDEGKRKARFHQWLTDFGTNQLTMQIGRVLGIIQISKNLDETKLNLARQKGLTIFEKDLFGAKEIIIKKRKNQEQNNLKSDKFIQNIQKDNLEFKDNDFESEIEKIALLKKKD